MEDDDDDYEIYSRLTRHFSSEDTSHPSSNDLYQRFLSKADKYLEIYHSNEPDSDSASYNTVKNNNFSPDHRTVKSSGSETSQEQIIKPLDVNIQSHRSEDVYENSLYDGGIHSSVPVNMESTGSSIIQDTSTWLEDHSNNPSNSVPLPQGTALNNKQHRSVHIHPDSEKHRPSDKRRSVTYSEVSDLTFQESSILYDNELQSPSFYDAEFPLASGYINPSVINSLDDDLKAIVLKATSDQHVLKSIVDEAERNAIYATNSMAKEPNRDLPLQASEPSRPKYRTTLSSNHSQTNKSKPQHSTQDKIELGSIPELSTNVNDDLTGSEFNPDASLSYSKSYPLGIINESSPKSPNSLIASDPSHIQPQNVSTNKPEAVLTMTTPFQSLELKTSTLIKAHNHSTKINSTEPYQAVIDLITNNNTDSHLKETLRRLLDETGNLAPKEHVITPRKPLSPSVKFPKITSSQLILSSSIENLTSAQIEKFSPQKSSRSTASPTKLKEQPTIALPGIVRLERLENASVVKTSAKKEKKKPLYMRLIEEAAKQEALEKQEKEKLYQKARSQRTKINPTSDDIKSHMKWHDKLVPLDQSKLTKESNNNIVQSTDIERSPVKPKRSSSTSPNKKLNPKKSEIRRNSDTTNVSQGSVVSAVNYLKRKSKRVRFKSKIEVKQSSVDALPSVSESPLDGDESKPSNGTIMTPVKQKQPPSHDDKSFNQLPPLSPYKEIQNNVKNLNRPPRKKFSIPGLSPPSRSTTPDQRRRPSSVGKPQSSDLDIDLSMFPHGPDWISNIFRKREDESKMAEIYEQGFAIMFMENES